MTMLFRQFIFTIQTVQLYPPRRFQSASWKVFCSLYFQQVSCFGLHHHLFHFSHRMLLKTIEKKPEVKVQSFFSSSNIPLYYYSNFAVKWRNTSQTYSENLNHTEPQNLQHNSSFQTQIHCCTTVPIPVFSLIIRKRSFKLLILVL